MKDDERLLDLLMRDALRQESIYRPDPYWLNSALSTAEGIRKFGLQRFRSDARVTPGGSFTDVPKIDPREEWVVGKRGRLLNALTANSFMKRNVLHKFATIIDRLYGENLLYKEYYLNASLGAWFEAIVRNHGLPDTLVGDCKHVVTMNGRKISVSYIDWMSRISDFSSKADFTKVNSVFIIGGGFGYEIHLLMHMYPNIKKCLYLDIPPMLYVATQYLKHFFGDAVRDYHELSERAQLRFSDSGEREILAIPPWLIGRFDDAVDVFWNSCSFQEIPQTVRENYARYALSFLEKAENPRICLIIYPWESPLHGNSSAESILGAFTDAFAFEEFRPERNIYLDAPPNRCFSGRRK